MSSVSRSGGTKIYLWLAVVLALGAGFVDLVRGGITLSAIALTVAYCVLIPLAIWRGGGAASGAIDRAGDEPGEPPPYGAAAMAAFAVFALYVGTLAPSTAMWDTSEYIAAAYTFGLPHPPGNPLFIIVGRVFSILPIARTVAQRINVLAALCSAVAAAAWFLIANQVLAAWIADRRQRVAGAALTAHIGATAFTVWNQSVVNEKVYTVSLAGIAIVSWLAVRWSVYPARSGADRMLVMIAYLCGLGYANHMAGMLPAPAVALAVLVRRPSTATRWRLLLACGAALLIGLTPFATQPIRAAFHPAINEGEPTACRTTIAVSCTFSKATLDAFEYNFNRGQYGKPALSDRQASFTDQVGMWWLYFKWQWFRDPDGRMPFLQSFLAAAFLVSGLAGGWIHFRRDRRTFWYFGALMFTTTLLLIYYLNFQLGASQQPGVPAPHEVRDRDYFFLWSYSAWSVWAAIGLASAWGTVASPVMLLAVVPLVANWSSASRAHHTTTRNVAADMLNSVEPYGVLVTVGDNDTFPLWYAQEVEGIRRDVVVANTSLLGTEWYARQLIRRPVYEYDAARGPALYRDRVWPKPHGPPMSMTLDEADAVPPYFVLNGPMRFDAGPYHATIDPRQLPHGVLERSDAFVLRMIQDSAGGRPIYFARSGISVPRALGLEANILTQGLAAKLFVPPAASSRDTMRVPGDGWLDVRRTEQLWTTVFTGHRSTVAEGRWIDAPSASMPLLYVFTGVELADALRATGREAEAVPIYDTARRIANIAGAPDLARAIDQNFHIGPPANDSAGVTLRGAPPRPQP
jgi:hypothetical protein